MVRPPTVCVKVSKVKKSIPKEDFSQTLGTVKFSESSISLDMSFRDVLVLKVECDKTKLKNLQDHLFIVSIISAIADDLGITNKLTWITESRSKQDRLVMPVIEPSVDTPVHKLQVLHDTLSELMADPEFNSYTDEISKSAVDFYQKNFVEELHSALDNFQWECHLLALKKAGNNQGLPASIPKKTLKRLKDLRLRRTKERLKIRPGRNPNSPTRSPEALERKQKKTKELIRERKAKLIDAAIYLLKDQSDGKFGKEISKTTLARAIGISRQSIDPWMKSCGYSLDLLEDEAVKQMRCKVNNST